MVYTQIEKCGLMPRVRRFALEGDSLEIIADEVRVCTKCDLYRTRTNAVPGAGNETASVLFIGEGPGYNEDQQGLPFVGQSGKFLGELLGHGGLTRDEVFITNVVKCRPPGNRDPLPDEIAACRGYLDRQITLIDPALIVTLGRFSMSRWFPGDRISRIHGQEKRADERTVMPMHHPAAALRQLAVKALVEADFQRLPQVLESAAYARNKRALTASPPEEAADQLSLF
ncbi:MAG TPA: uracil-DNA glycosylase [Thermomicrobiales bacterium]|nr:uracil-DNA glycosylase [Thermomicrobiales bacterium]